VKSAIVPFAIALLVGSPSWGADCDSLRSQLSRAEQDELLFMSRSQKALASKSACEKANWATSSVFEPFKDEDGAWLETMQGLTLAADRVDTLKRLQHDQRCPY
jgi:hypothetical protein